MAEHTGAAEGTDRARVEALVTTVATRWSASLLRVARRHSVCDDDAQDAYQRAMELLVRHAARLEPERVHRWLHVVVKHEAMRLREQRTARVDDGAEPVAYAEDAGPEDHVLDLDDLERAADALGALKPQELRALWLQAEGMSYRQIAAATSWSYTKVNRCITEGRRAFLVRYRDLEAGEACDALAAGVLAVAGGERRVGQVPGLRAHLRHCGLCRATLRETHLTDAPIAALLPPAGLLPGAEAHVREAAVHAVTRAYEAVALGVQERAAGAAVRVQTAAEALMSGKAAAVAASAAAIAGGGAAAVERVARPDRGPAVAARPAPLAALPVAAPGDPGAKVVPRDEVRPLPIVAEQRVRRVVAQRARERDAREFAAAAARRRDRAAKEFSAGATAGARTSASREFATAAGSASGPTAPRPAAPSGPAAAEFAGSGSTAGSEFGP